VLLVQMANLLLSVALCLIFAFITIEAESYEAPVMYCQQSACQPCWVISGGYAVPAGEEVDGPFIDNEYTSSETCTETADLTWCTDYCNDVWDAWQACGMELEVGPGEYETFPACTLYACLDPPCPTEKRTVKRSLEETNGNFSFIWSNGWVYNSSITPPQVTDPEPKYLGCFKDALPRDLIKQGPNVDSIDECIAWCSGELYPIAGLEDGGQCFCGVKYTTYGEIDGDNCEIECPDDEDCGGIWALEIYTTGWIGCYHDSSIRDLAVMINDGTDGPITVEECRLACFTDGYKYAAPQDGDQCSCGDTYGTEGLSTGNCFTQCDGNTGEWCGGGYANAIFTAQASPTF